MAEKFLNNTGLEYYHNRAKTIFENKIEKVKVNGTEQTITNKEVDLSIPTAESNSNHNFIIDDNKTGNDHAVLTLNSTGADRGVFVEVQKGDPTGTITRPISAELASTDYVNANGGKIDKIKVNGTEQTITNKEVDLTVAEVHAEEMGDTGKSDSITISNKECGFAINKDLGVSLLSANGHLDHHFYLADIDYVDSKGSIAIDSANNNKTTFTVGSKTSSLATSPDGVIYTEGAAATQLTSKAYVDDAIAGVTGMEFVLVDTLPAEGEKGKIYLVPNNTAGSNIKDEYIWIQDGANGRFEKIGSTDVDLTEYWAKSDLEAITTAEIDTLFA